MRLFASLQMWAKYVISSKTYVQPNPVVMSTCLPLSYLMKNPKSCLPPLCLIPIVTFIGN